MHCENCKTEINSSYGSGRFCSSRCARSFSTKSKRKQINEKVSSALIGKKSKTQYTNDQKKKWLDRVGSPESREKAKNTLVRNCKQRLLELEFNDLGPVQRRRRIILEQKDSCNSCNLSLWLNKPITLEIEHIDGNNKNNNRENLVALCPNCHSQTNTWRKKKSALVVKQVKASALEAEDFVGSSPT